MKKHKFKKGDLVEIEDVHCAGHRAVVKCVYPNAEYRGLMKGSWPLLLSHGNMLVDLKKWPSRYKGTIQKRGYYISEDQCKLLKQVKTKNMASKKVSAGKTQDGKKFFRGDVVQAKDTSCRMARRSWAGWRVIGYDGSPELKEHEARDGRGVNNYGAEKKGKLLLKKAKGFTFIWCDENELVLKSPGPDRTKVEKMTLKEKKTAKTKKELQKSLKKIKEGSAEKVEVENRLSGLMSILSHLGDEEK